MVLRIVEYVVSIYLIAKLLHLSCRQPSRDSAALSTVDDTCILVELLRLFHPSNYSTFVGSA